MPLSLSSYAAMSNIIYRYIRRVNEKALLKTRQNKVQFGCSYGAVIPQPIYSMQVVHGLQQHENYDSVKKALILLNFGVYVH